MSLAWPSKGFQTIPTAPIPFCSITIVRLRVAFEHFKSALSQRPPTVAKRWWKKISLAKLLNTAFISHTLLLPGSIFSNILARQQLFGTYRKHFWETTLRQKLFLLCPHGCHSSSVLWIDSSCIPSLINKLYIFTPLQGVNHRPIINLIKKKKDALSIIKLSKTK